MPPSTATVLRVATRVQCLLEGRTTLAGRPQDLTRPPIESAYFGLATPAEGLPYAARVPTEAAGRLAEAESLLSRHHAAPVTITEWQHLTPWAVARARLQGHPDRVIVKWMRPHPGPGYPTSWRHRTESAALRFLSDDLALSLAPRVIAADPSAELLVLEDLAPRTALDRLLRAQGAPAHMDRLAAFARVRGELNAVTAGRAALYHARRAALGPDHPVVSPMDEARAQAAVLGAPITGRAETELTAALDELAAPGPFLALSNGDPEANNVLVHECGAPDPRLIDFEFAGYTHALNDAVCLHVPGPAWLSVDPSIADHYRRALAAGVPEAEDDRRYGFGLAAACVRFALLRLGRLPALDARVPGDDSRPQLIAALEATARTAESHHALPHLTGWARRAADTLRRRWPDADRTTAPPYTPRH
ncbi:hypothetical protein [Nonomuraea sp. NPDC002799]